MPRLLRFSRQRNIILDAVKKTDAHPTADNIYTQLKQQHPELSLGTVYRNLNVLVEMGEIIRVGGGNGAEHFDGDCSEHAHLLCRQCGRIFDLSCDVDAYLGRLKEQNAHQSIESLRILADGVCSRCCAE